MDETITNKSSNIDLIKKAITGKRIFFAHQSVGFNLIDGIKLNFSKAETSPFKIVEIKPGFYSSEPAFLHMPIGNNRDPLSKIHEFEDQLNSNIFPTPDIAALKFCYVDILGPLSPSEIFTAYEDMITRIKYRHPSITFLHFTMPLMTDSSQIDKIKNLLFGSPLIARKENLLRHQYNQLLINRYLDDEYIFDMAKYESISPEGSHCLAKYLGTAISCMCRAYTSDGGHLNHLGKETISFKLIKLLGLICSNLSP